MKIKVLSKRDAIPKGFTVVDTTSHSQNWSRGLSPMILGPCQTPDGHQARTVEQLWQYSKVYARHLKDGNITEEYFRWREDGFKATRAERYPMGKGARPEFSLWGEKRLIYIPARKEIYFPIYRDTLAKSQAWQTLKALHGKKDIALIDFDGYDHQVQGKSLAQVINSPRTMGHAFVIKAMLLRGEEVTIEELPQTLEEE